MNQKLKNSLLEHSKYLSLYPFNHRKWAFIQAQVDQVDALCARTFEWQDQIKVLEKTLKSVHSVYTKTCKMLKTTINEFKQTCPEPDANLVPCLVYLEEIGCSHAVFVHLLQSKYLPKVESFKVIKDAKQFNNDLLAHQLAIKAIRAKMFKSLDKHEKFILEFGSSARANLVDPWLREQVLFKEIELLVEKENEFQSKSLEIKQEMARFEAQLTQKMSSFYKDLFSSSALRSEITIEKNKTIGDVLDGLKETSFYENYWASHGLVSDDIWLESKTLATCSLVEEPILILKKRLLQRPATIRKNKWKPCLYVLTETGYIHCFNTTQSSSSKNKEQVPNAEIYKTLKKPSTFFRQPKIKLRLLTEPSNLHVLQLIVPENNNLFRKESVYSIKCNNEAELVEWTSLIQEKMESFLPLEPPKPIYKTVQRVESEIEDIVLLKDISAQTLIEGKADGATTTDLTLGKTENASNYPNDQQFNKQNSNNKVYIEETDQVAVKAVAVVEDMPVASIVA